MNRLNFNQSVGFPLETEILSEMQTAWSILNALGGIAGNFAILQGCTVIGNTVSDGVVFINGEVIEFKGGQLQENVIILETPTVLEFEDNSEHEVIYTRFATFGAATTQYPWNGFKGFKNTVELTEDKAEKATVETLIKRIEDLESRPLSNVPAGLIAIWGQAANLIPKGWKEYAPLRGRMPIGMDESQTEFDALLAQGGQKTQTLTVEQMPAHDHQIPVFNKNAAGTGAEKTIDGNLASTNKMTTNKTGQGKSFDIMNPYRVVLYIQYVG